MKFWKRKEEDQEKPTKKVRCYGISLQLKGVCKETLVFYEYDKPTEFSELVNRIKKSVMSNTPIHIDGVNGLDGTVKLDIFEPKSNIVMIKEVQYDTEI